MWGRDHVLNPHRRRSGPDAVEGVIAVVDQIAWRFVPTTRLAHLLDRPRRRRMRGDRDVPDTPPVVREEHQDEHERQVMVGTTKKSAATIWPR